MTKIVCLCLFAFTTGFLATTSVAQTQTLTPEWIWHSNAGQSATNGEVRLFRKTFTIEGRVSRAVLSAAADDRASISLNGSPAIKVNGFERATRMDVTEFIRSGENQLTVQATNETSIAGVLVRLELSLPGRRRETIVSDASWLASVAKPTNWVSAVSLGKVGQEPWGDPLKSAHATAAETLTVPPGFKVELIRTAEAEEGSWISMAVDNKGRLIISPQDDRQPLLRVTLTKAGQVEKVEPIPAKLRQAMGMLYAHDSLYVNGHGPSGTGLYRLIDANRNDQFDTNEVHFLKKFQGEGEHGYHAVVEGPDRMIYVMNGNHTKVPEGILPSSPFKNYQEDFLLTRLWDANGHAVGIMAPGGYVVRTDAEGKKWELMLAGFRNSYDFDFSPEGEMFTFDSDMEWDWGLPWYRPTRIIHCVTGGEYGWRSGTSNEPEYYADTLPAAVNIGIGSPTGVKFGTKSNYPERYRKALFAMDWSYGRILAVHLKPEGASYIGDYENFVKGKPLNVADLEFGKDGAMYFITGGRGTQSGLYRVSYDGKSVGTRSAASQTRDTVEHVPTRKELKQSADARALRKKLESFYKKDPKAIDFAWPHLASEDRFIRFAARTAIEWQDVGLWKDRAIKETNPQAGLTALLALARCGGKETQDGLLRALAKFPLSGLSEELQLEKLRVIELSFIRQGRPSEEMTKVALEKLSPRYPSTSQKVNYELVQLLIYLNAPDVIAKTLDLIAKAPTQEEQIHYMFHLRNVKSGWTLPQREQYFRWFATAKQGGRGEVTYPRGGTYNVWTNQALASRTHPLQLLRWFKEVDRDYGDGSSYSKFLINIRKDANATLTSSERTALAPLLEINIDAPPWKPTRERKFIKEWTVAELEARLPEVAQGRDFNSGKAAFNDAQCVSCHRFDNQGGSVGPELTGVSSKYSRRDILESLIEPSKVVSDQFQNFNIVKTDGDMVSGRITDENDRRIIILPNMLAPEATVEIPVSEITSRQPSKVSAMPTGLLNQLTADEILDLLAYIEAGGKPRAANFQTVKN
ncbi:MAG TPA: c-type cytochrome [Verrucomicrobiae bacterium]|nr:c-type cytochrome [Verrucomicrobiae bacterium]